MKNLIWSLLSNFGLKAFMMLLNVYFANMIGISQFGMYILLISLLSLVASFSEGGFIYSLIRKKTIHKKDYFNCLVMSLSFSLTGYIIIFILIFGFNFYFPKTKILLALCFIYLICISFNYIQLAFLERQMKFGKIFKFNLISFLFSVTLSLALSLVNKSFLVPVVLFASQPFFFLILAPKKHIFKKGNLFSLFDLDTIKEHFIYGKYILLGSVLNSAYNNFFNFFINYKLSIESLSILERSKTYSEMFSSLFGLSVSKVTYPKLCVIKDKSDLEETIIKKLISGIVLFIPITVLVSIIIKDVIKLIYYEEWWNIIPYLQYLILCSFLSVSTILIQLVYRVENQNLQGLKNEVVKKVFLISLIICSSFFGIDSIIYSIGFGIVISFVINLYFVNKFISISLIKILKKTIIPITVSFLLYFGLSYTLDNSFLLIIFYSVFYFGLISYTNKEETSLIFKTKIL